MTLSRTEIFAQMAKDDPENALVWYGLGSEHFKEAKWLDAIVALKHVVRLKPDYTAAYQMLGSALDAHGERDEARSIWRAGIEIANLTNAWKARDHMQALLDTNEARGDLR